MTVVPAAPVPHYPAVAKIFGREPAFVLGLAEGILTFLLAFAWGVGQDTYGPILIVVQVLVGLYVAWVTNATLLGGLVGLAKALVTLFAVYGFTLTDAQTASIVALVTVVASAWNRNQTFPEYDPPKALPGTVPVTDVGAA